jgi:hypothetical protein
MNANYEAALKTANDAARKFRGEQIAYRNRTIGDAEFLAAKAEHDAACKVFDAAYNAEVARTYLSK